MAIMFFIAKLWGNSYLPALMVGASMGTTSVEGNVVISVRSTNTRPLGLAVPLWGVCPVVPLVHS